MAANPEHSARPGPEKRRRRPAARACGLMIKYKTPAMRACKRGDDLKIGSVIKGD
jgi:hypothetical protein